VGGIQKTPRWPGSSSLARDGDSFVGRTYEDIGVDSSEVHLVWNQRQRMDAFFARAEEINELAKYLQRHPDLYGLAPIQNLTVSGVEMPM